MDSLSLKYEKLRSFVEEKGRDGVVIAFSGGVDSSTLAAVCFEVLGGRAVAVIGDSPTYPSGELELAKKIAGEIGIRHFVVETCELSDENFVKNPEDHCYYCKKDLIGCLQDFGFNLGFNVVFEGTNFSDLGSHRPGFKAVEEVQNVFSPWVICEFTKDDIRELAQKLGFSFFDKPSLACLSSRIPFGERITVEKLVRVSKAEQFIKNISGVRQVRVRDHNGLARIEVGVDERYHLLDIVLLDRIKKELKQLGFSFITFDLEGYRSGSMLMTVENNEKSS